MSQLHSKLNRNIEVCGDQLKHYRRLLGWTQEELAHRSGYCDRVIRKAESGKSLSIETIEVIAQALSCDGVQVSPEDLVHSPKKTIGRLLDKLHGRAETKHTLNQLVTRDVVVVCKGSDRVPFSGSWRGRDEFDDWLACLCRSTTTRLEHEEELMAVDGGIAFLQTKVVFRRGTILSTPTEVVFHMEFDRSLIRLLRLNADSSVIEDFFTHD